MLGKEGRGILEVFDVYDGVDLVTGSFGKAIGTFGGFIAARNKIIDEFRYKTPMYFYSTALPPLIAAATLISLQYTKEHPELREKITIYAKKLYSALNTLKFRLTDSTTPLVSVVFPSSADTFRAAKMLFERGVYGVPFIPPSVPKRSPRIRLTINAALKEEDIDAVIEAFTEIAKAEPRWLI